MKNVAQRCLICTEDGSSSLRLNDFDEQFHSVHGAYSESMHVYINAGFKALSSYDTVSVLEMGLGTGLNAYLTYLNQAQQKVRYHAVEAYPLTEGEWSRLTFPGFDVLQNKAFFERLHQSGVGEWCSLTDDFSLKKDIAHFEEVAFEADQYDLVYYDAFSPDVQPELWTAELFAKIYRAMRKNAVLVTYCAKGVVKRTLKSVGFELESLPGPVGKREITRCIKK